jgi:DNA topoisomerase VI subunit A
MFKNASSEVIDALGAFLHRYAGFSSTDVRTHRDALGHGRAPVAKASSNVLRHNLDQVSNVESSSNVRQLSAGAGDSRLAGLLHRNPLLLTPPRFPTNALAAVDAPANEVLSRLADLSDQVAAQIRAGELPSIDIPDLHSANGVYDDRGNVFLGSKVRRLALDHQGGKAFVRLLLTIEKATENLRSGVHTTKRGLYYQHRAHFPDLNADQVDSDRALTALANILGVRRKSLGFVESQRGMVYGRLILRDGGQIVDLSQTALGGRSIDRFTEDTEILASDAGFVLIVEKFSVACRLAQLRWWESARCIVVCGEGHPSTSAREFVRKLVEVLGIPALVCVDADPGGVQIALTYAHGAIATALETPWFACNNIWWAGLCPSDIEKHCANDDLIRLSETDVEHALRLVKHPSLTYINSRVREELNILLDRGVKVELDALSNDMTRFANYLQKKICDSDLVRI